MIFFKYRYRYLSNDEGFHLEGDLVQDERVAGPQGVHKDRQDRHGRVLQGRHLLRAPQRGAWICKG